MESSRKDKKIFIILFLLRNKFFPSHHVLWRNENNLLFCQLYKWQAKVKENEGAITTELWKVIFPHKNFFLQSVIQWHKLILCLEVLLMFTSKNDHCIMLQ